MDQPSHLGGVNNCRRNCRGNPSCLVGLGERAWLDAEEEEDSDGEEADELVWSVAAGCAGHGGHSGVIRVD